MAMVLYTFWRSQAAFQVRIALRNRWWTRGPQPTSGIRDPALAARALAIHAPEHRE
jgi:hypothetical protein